MNKQQLKDYFKVFSGYLTVIVLVGGTGYWIWKNPIYNPAGPQSQDVKSDIEVRFLDAVVKGRRNGTAHWTAYSKIVESERNSSRVFFKDKPHGEFYNIKDWSKADSNNEKTNPSPFPSGIPAPISPQPINNQPDRLRTFTWDADTAEYNTETDDLILKKNVNIVTDDKDKIKTDELNWNNFSQKATSNTRTKITSAKGYPTVDADHVEGDVKLDLLNLKGHVEITTVLTDDQEL